MIRGTLTRGLNRPQNAKHELSNQAHEGLQSPSNPKERKGLKEAHFAHNLRPGSTVQPIRTPLELAEQSPLRSRVANLPSSGQIISASLEGSGPTLEQATHFRLARGHPSA